MSNFWASLSLNERFAIAFGVVMAPLVVLSLRHALGRWLVAALAFLPVPIIALFSTQFGLVGWHGFMHTAAIYQLMNGGPVPPEDPLFAGGSIRYPWVEQWIVAQVCRITGANVHVLTLSVEIVAYGVLLAAGYWLASAISKNRSANALAVLFTGFGIALVHGSLLVEPFGRLFPTLWLESRVIPVDKFANITAMPIGYAAMAVAAAAAVRLAAGLGAERRLAAIVAGGTLVAAFIHPLSWLCLFAWTGVVGLYLLAARAREDYVRLAWLAAAVAIPSALAFPYLRSVGISESSDGWSGLTRPASLWGAKLGDLAVYLAPLLVLATVYRATLREELRSGNRALRVALAIVPCMAAGYLLVRFPGRNEYKFLLCLVPAGAAIMGLCMSELLERQRLVGGVLLALLLMPAGMILGSRPWFVVTEPARADGRYLRALDESADELYQWIANETPANAVFVSTEYGIPALGRRGLYIVPDTPWRGRNGWGVTGPQLLQYHVRRPDAVMASRQERARILLGPSWSRRPSDVVRAIESDIPGRPLFVQTRDRAAMLKFDKTPGFQHSFRNAAGAIYAVMPSASMRPESGFELAALNSAIRREQSVRELVDQSARLLQKEKASEALALLGQAVSLSINDSGVWNNLCVAHGILRHRAQAVAACERSTALNPQNQLARNNLAWVSSLPPP